MVNAKSLDAAPASDRRDRPRAAEAELASLGVVHLNPFGDLHTLQHLCARLARTLKLVFDPLLRADVRVWAEPLAVQRFADYRAERGETLSAWLALPTGAEAPAQAVFEGGFVLEILDLFFGGSGHAPTVLPKEFSPAAAAMVGRLGRSLAPLLKAAWEPVARLDFTVGAIEANPTTLAGVEAGDALVVTRFGVARGDAKPAFFDLLYPVVSLKPHSQGLTGKVHARTPVVDPAWRATLTRAVMGVRFPVRSVLAEPMMPLARLLELKVGDVIPIGLGDEIPIMVGNDRIGTGTVGTANGHAAIQLTAIASLEGPMQ